MAGFAAVIPAYNAAASVGDVVRRTRAILPEIVVVDDGSTDGTKATVEALGDRVRYLWQPNTGPAAARNAGIAAAAGAFISFLDSDDLWHPEKLACQIARFQARPELDLCVTHIQNFWMPEVAEEERRLRDGRHARPLPGYSSVTLVARRSLFEAIGVFDASLKHGDDTEWFGRVEQRGAVAELLPEVLVRRRLHANNRSRHWVARSRAEYLALMRTLVGKRRAVPSRDGLESPTAASPRSESP